MEEHADFKHIFWTCLKIQIFWAEVTQFIAKLTTVAFPLSIEVCLLGLVSSLPLVGHLEPFLAYSSFMLVKLSY